jgi:hypothetical protein
MEKRLRPSGHQPLSMQTRRRPTLPLSRPSSTIGAGGLNCRVRNGNGCGPSAKVTGKTVVTERYAWAHPENCIATDEDDKSGQ